MAEPREHALVSPAEKERARSRFEAEQRRLPGYVSSRPAPVEETKLSDIDRLVAIVEAKCPTARQLEMQLQRYYRDSSLVDLGYELGLVEPTGPLNELGVMEPIYLQKVKTRASLCREIAGYLSKEFRLPSTTGPPGCRSVRSA